MSTSPQDVVHKIQQKIEMIKRQIPFASSSAINKTLTSMKKEQTDLLKSVIKKPVPFTLKAIQYKKATKQNLTGELFISQQQNEWLTFTIEGGKRIAQKKSIAVPVNKKILNSSGDIPRSKITIMLKSKKKYFNAKQGQSTLTPGIYENIKVGRGKRISKLLLVWKQYTQYNNPQYKFKETTDKHVKENMPKNLSASIDRAISTAR